MKIEFNHRDFRGRLSGTRWVIVDWPAVPRVGEEVNLHLDSEDNEHPDGEGFTGYVEKVGWMRDGSAWVLLKGR